MDTKFLAVPPAIFLAFCLATVGCNSSAKNMAEASGKITLDGSPVAEGIILVYKAEGERRGYEAKITNGSYKLRCEAGKLRVEILAYRDVPGKTTTINAREEQVREMYIPKKYNEETTLTAEFKPGVNENVSFDLTSR